MSVDWAAIDTVVCDIDGVVLLGSEPIAGVAAALHRLRAAGLEVVFISNNSTKTRATIANRLSDIVGFEAAASHVINSGWATACHIADKVGEVYVVGTEGLRDTLREAGISITSDWRSADAVVAGLDFNVTFAALAEAALAIQNGAAFYATNTDASFPTPEGQYPGAGALVAAIATTTGRTPLVCGKPHEPMRRLLDGFVGKRAVIVGDRPETDIALGKAEGWATALVMTGVTATLDEVPEEYLPDLVLDSLAELPAAIGR